MIAPEKRPGRPRVEEAGPSRPAGAPPEKRTPRPELVCWKEGRRWLAGVEVPDALQAAADLAVWQGAEQLDQDKARPGYWPLRQIGLEVVVTWQDDQRRECKLLTDGAQHEYLVFKLSGEEDFGRCVTMPSRGDYLVLAPEGWKRDEALAGQPRVRPEASMPGYQAHFFDVEPDAGQVIALRASDGRLIQLSGRSARYELVGCSIPDHAKRMGPLFVGEPPVIRALDDRLWEEVRTIIIGAEGAGRDGWRESIDPRRHDREQQLPTALDERGGGWYFLRFYDPRDRLVDSCAFRYCRGLTDVVFEPPPPLPDQRGHGQVTVIFHHQPGWSVRLASQQVAGLATVPTPCSTTVTLPAVAEADETRWEIGRGSAAVRLTLRVERVWWARGTCSKEPVAWTDQPVEFKRADIMATSQEALWVRLPGTRWAERIHFGFDGTRLRSYPIAADAQVVAIPLRDFGDAPRAGMLGMAPLRLQVERQGQSHSAIVGCLTIQLGCCHCRFTVADQTAMEEHIKEHHLRELMPALNYNELRARLTHLPRAIYRCNYCGYLVDVGGYENANTKMQLHIDRDCKKVRRTTEPPRVRLEPITDVELIRRQKLKELPRLHRCTLCSPGCEIEDESGDELMAHLLENHRQALYELC